MFRNFFSDTKPRVGLALSGGGARGFAHCGAIKAMDEVGIKPDVIAGVSAGSVVAVLYAAGRSPEEIMQMFLDASFTDFASLAVPRNGFFRMDGFRRFLRRAIPYENLEDLPIPTYIGATDIDHGRAVAFDHGPIIERVIASCSIPIVFQPVRIDNTTYVDGGVLHNLPSWIIRDKCRYLFGINCSPLLEHEHYKNSILDIAQRTYNLLVKTNARPDMALCDLCIETTAIAHYKVFNLRGIRRVYRTGYCTAMDRLLEVGFKVASKTEAPSPSTPTT